MAVFSFSRSKLAEMMMNGMAMMCSMAMFVRVWAAAYAGESL